MARRESICVANSNGEQFSDSSSKEECTKWHELGEFWGVEKRGILDLNKLPNSISCNSGKHSVFGGSSSGIVRNESTKSTEINNSYKMVRGADVNDIPTTYVAAGFKPHELIVIGTYLEKNIVPGFQYKVRKNLTEEYLFDGEALTLENAGLGYGKRLTFSGGHNLNNNKNYFWSDSHTPGFGLTFQTISPNSVFRIIDTKSNIDIGRIIVNNPAKSADIEVSTDVQDDGLVQKTVKIHFSADIVISNNKLNMFYEDTEIKGTAVVQRVDKFSKAKVKEIMLEIFPVDNCSLVPEE